MKSSMNLASLVTAAVGIALPQAATADAVTDWNQKAIALLVDRGVPTTPAERILAITHIAIFDSLNSIDGKYAPYLASLDGFSNASREAAIASAAATVLSNLDPKSSPSQTDKLSGQKVASSRDATTTQDKSGIVSEFESYVATIPETSGKQKGIALGRKAAELILESRNKDGADMGDRYKPRTAPGVYVPTATVSAPH